MADEPADGGPLKSNPRAGSGTVSWRALSWVARPERACLPRDHALSGRATQTVPLPKSGRLKFSDSFPVFRGARSCTPVVLITGALTGIGRATAPVEPRRSSERHNS